MKALGPALLFIPEELFGVLILGMLIVGGFAMMVGARKTAGTLVITALSLPLISVLVQAVVNSMFAFLPDWLIVPMAVILTILCYLLLIPMLIKALVGQTIWNHAMGELLADFIKWTFFKIFTRTGMIFVACMFVLISLQVLLI